jgi:hypothetical protein
MHRSLRILPPLLVDALQVKKEPGNKQGILEDSFINYE